MEARSPLLLTIALGLGATSACRTRLLDGPDAGLHRQDLAPARPRCDGGASSRPLAFAPVEDFPTGVLFQVQTMTSADVDADGYLDVIVTADQSWSVLYGQADGRLLPTAPMAMPWFTTTSPIAFENGGGALDVAIGVISDRMLGTAGKLVVYPNQGGHQFGAPTVIDAPSLILGLATGDFDGDGRADLVGCGSHFPISGGPTGALFLSRGDHQLASPVAFDGGRQCYRLVTGDFDGNGKLDLAVTDVDSGTPGAAGAGVRVFLGRGDGSLGPATLYPVGPDVLAYRLQVADTDGDGALDLVAPYWANPPSQPVQLRTLRGSGHGDFSAGPTAQLAAFVEGAFTMLDLDGDDRLDAAVVASDAAGVFTVQALLASGNGGWSAPVTLVPPIQRNPWDLAPADRRCDGRSGLFFLREIGFVSVLRPAD